MRKIRIAQIEIGHDHADMVYNSLVEQADVFDVQRFFSPGEERYMQKKSDVFGNAKQLTLEEVMNDVDIEAVAIETEEENLTKYLLMAAEHGKHIHMDKPSGTEFCDYEKIRIYHHHVGADVRLP